MKKMNFEQMNVVNGGACTGEGLAFLGGALTSIFGGPLALLSWGLTAYAYYNYMDCMIGQLG